MGGFCMGFKTTDGLMRHLRNTGIAIAGSSQKRQLINTGYFHGYKGYRFLRTHKTDFLLPPIVRFTQQFNMTRH